MGKWVESEDKTRSMKTRHKACFQECPGVKTHLVTRCWPSKRRFSEWTAEHPTHREPACLATGGIYQMQDGLCLAVPVQTVPSPCFSDRGTP